ncbi:MAG: TonB-dependent receptor [Corallincola sp.]|nr:TonB-dependent receptor [Corallincola sp.]
MDPWHTYSYGVFAEHQWQLAARWTNFLGLRFDQDEYTDPMWSPRWALVYTPSEQDTVKAIISRSVRKNNAEELRKQHLADQTSKPEVLTSAELIHERQWSPRLSTALSGFYSDVEVIGFDTTDLRSRPVADFRYGGLELTAAWSNDQFDLSGSHAWTKLDDFTQAPGASQKISVAHLGYGNELSNWSDNITKLVLGWQLAPQWRLSGSVRVFWDYEGAREVTRQTNDARAASTIGRSSSTALSDPGYDDSFEEAIFVDLGVHYQLPGSGQLAVHGYNLLGLVDERYNKRMYLINVQNYQAEATAVAIIYRQPF